MYHVLPCEALVFNVITKPLRTLAAQISTVNNARFTLCTSNLSTWIFILLRHWSLDRTWLRKAYTSYSKQHSQTARLVEGASRKLAARPDGVLTLYGMARAIRSNPRLLPSILFSPVAFWRPQKSERDLGGRQRQSCVSRPCAKRATPFRALH